MLHWRPRKQELSPSRACAKSASLAWVCIVALLVADVPPALGLSISHNYIRSHGGYIQVERVEGSGATLDVVLPGINGIEVLRQAQVASPATIVLMMSAYHMVVRTVEAMKLGAYDYLIKPFHIEDMEHIATCVEMLALRVRVHDTVQTAKGQYDLGRVVTQRPVMREVLEMARRASESERTTILIQDPSGTGKEVLAKAIHYNSQRAQMPLISLNCAALPDTLLESELFGFELGAFTDTRRRKEGLIEKASGGTLFLDEIGNTSSSLQSCYVYLKKERLCGLVEQRRLFTLTCAPSMPQTSI
jgi:two-component system response regulator AtoC